MRVSNDRIFLCLGFCGRGEKFLCGFRKIFHGRGNPFLPVIKNKQIHFNIKACYGKESEIFSCRIGRVAYLGRKEMPIFFCRKCRMMARLEISCVW